MAAGAGLLRALGLAALLLPAVPRGPPGGAERRCFCQVGRDPRFRGVWGVGGLLRVPAALLGSPLGSASGGCRGMGARLSWPPGWLLRGVWESCGAVVVGNHLILSAGGLC